MLTLRKQMDPLASRLSQLCLSPSREGAQRRSRGVPAAVHLTARGTGRRESDHNAEISMESTPRARRSNKEPENENGISASARVDGIGGSGFRGRGGGRRNEEWRSVDVYSSDDEDDFDCDENNPRLMNKITTTTTTTTTPCTPNTKKRTQDFKRIRYDLAQQLFEEYNAIVFGNRLPSDLCVSWNKRLLTKAGCTLLREQRGDRSTREAKIELSDKVLTDLFRLKSTLLHEMIHVANWLLDGTTAETKHHGPEFKKWADVVHARVPGVEITTYHSYDIHKSHHFECTGTDCGAKFMRHSKKGLDITKRVCGRCKSKIEYVGKFNENGEAETPRTPSKYSNFVKEHYKVIRRRHSKLGRGDIMRKIAEAYREAESSKPIEVVD